MTCHRFIVEIHTPDTAGVTAAELAERLEPWLTPHVTDRAGAGQVVVRSLLDWADMLADREVLTAYAVLNRRLAEIATRLSDGSAKGAEQCILALTGTGPTGTWEPF